MNSHRRWETLLGSLR